MTTSQSQKRSCCRNGHS